QVRDPAPRRHWLGPPRAGMHNDGRTVAFNLLRTGDRSSHNSASGALEARTPLAALHIDRANAFRWSTNWGQSRVGRGLEPPRTGTRRSTQAGRPTHPLAGQGEAAVSSSRRPIESTRSERGRATRTPASGSAARCLSRPAPSEDRVLPPDRRATLF